MKCVQDKKDATEANEHQLWHNLLTLRKDLIDVERQEWRSTGPTVKESSEVQLEAQISEDQRHAKIIASIADINARIDVLGGALDERMSTIESKMDNMMMEMKAILVVLSAKKNSRFFA
jgi:hypothetical protein